MSWFTLGNVNYDNNGNITNLLRNGRRSNNTFGIVDNLNYTYNTNSNKILKVDDVSTETASFKDVAGNDYTYSADGSLTSDANKGITLIEYNYLKRPKKYTFSNGSTLENQYDATGKKLKSISSDGTVYDFVGNIIYKNNVLYQISHDEGRIINGEYEFEIKDYLGNLRVSFRDSLGIAKITQKQDYDVYGSELQGLSYTKPLWNQDNFKFLGRESIAQTGYVDLINRQYDKILGRFTSLDPVTDGQESQSLYQYGWNNAINKSDPNGDFCIPCATAIIGGVVGAGLNAYDQHKAGTLSFSAKSIGRIVTAGAVGAIAGSGLGGLGGAVAASSIGEAADQYIQTGEVGDKKKVVISGVAAALTGGLVKGGEAVAVKSGIVAIVKRTISENSTTKIVSSAGKAALNSSSRTNVKSAEATTKSIVEGVSGVASYVGGNTAAKVLTPSTTQTSPTNKEKTPTVQQPKN